MADVGSVRCSSEIREGTSGLCLAETILIRDLEQARVPSVTYRQQHTQSLLCLRGRAAVGLPMATLLLRTDNCPHKPSDTPHVAHKPDALSKSYVALTACEFLSFAIT